MTELELQALIDQGEGFHLEFKESGEAKNLSKEIVAFANTKGGIILIGVDDDGVIKSKRLTNDDRSKVESVARNCDPSIDILVETVDNQPNVLVIHVKEALNKPYRCSTGFYAREGASSVKRTTDEIYQMFRDGNRFSFDDTLCLKSDFETDFEPTTLKRFLAEAKITQNLTEEDTLSNLGVLKEVEGKKVFTNAGVLFFTHATRKLLPHAIIQCARYNGLDKVDIDDYKEMDQDVISNIDGCFTFLRRSLDVGFEFETGKPTRNERWEIPYQALKEAIVNAIAHRDYIERGSHIQVEVFDDRVSITNFGGLLRGMKEEDLGRKSVRRNHELVNLFHIADFIEKLGTGILRINQELKAVGLPDVEFEVNEYWFTIVFKRKKISQLEDSQLKDLEFYHLTESKRKVLELCKSKPSSRLEIFAHLGMSNETRNFKRHVEPLIEFDLLIMTEPNKPRSRNQKYLTTKLGKEVLQSSS